MKTMKIISPILVALFAVACGGKAPAKKVVKKPAAAPKVVAPQTLIKNADASFATYYKLLAEFDRDRLRYDPAALDAKVKAIGKSLNSTVVDYTRLVALFKNNAQEHVYTVAGEQYVIYRAPNYIKLEELKIDQSSFKAGSITPLHVWEGILQQIQGFYR